MMRSSSICRSEEVSISSLVLEAIFAGYRMLVFCLFVFLSVL